MKDDNPKPPSTVTRVVASDDGQHTLVTLSLSKDDAEKLIARFNDGGLADLGVIELQVTPAKVGPRTSKWKDRARTERPHSDDKHRK